MLAVLLWIALWFYVALGFHTALFLGPWRERFLFVRWLPLPAEPDHVNASRVVGTVLYALLLFAFWPIFWWRRFRGDGMLPDDGAVDRVDSRTDDGSSRARSP